MKYVECLDRDSGLTVFVLRVNDPHRLYKTKENSFVL